jgi:GNAT superfamily N-acetyltransferase
MSIEVNEVKTKKELKKFIKFQMKLYEGNPYYVPQLIRDEMEIFDKKKNPAYEIGDTKLFLAYKDGQIVGRIAALLNKAANEKYKQNNLRFGWFDSIDDFEVAKALFDKVEEWGKELGMETLTGPQGFTDLDPEGMLIEGFEELQTIATMYNYPYYKELVEKYGFKKEIDYIEFQTKTPRNLDDVPEKLKRTAKWVKERYGFKLMKFKSVKEAKKHGKELFDLLDEAYEELYGTSPLTEKQKEYYIKKYIPFVNPKLLEAVENDKGEMIGFMITMPSLSKAFQKAKGRLFPFGFIHILKGLKTYETLDFYLAAVKKEYRGKGVDLLMVLDIIEKGIEFGFKNGESNPELETNKKIQGEWKYFNPRQHKRRRIFIKNIIK